MIYNQYLDRLIEIQIVQDFMRKHRMQGKLCSKGENHSFILHRLPYVVEFHDALIENYLEIKFSDLNSGLLIDGGVAFARSLDLVLQDMDEIRRRSFEQDPKQGIFLSDGVRKLDDLDSNLEAIDKLLPLLEAKGGLSSMRNGTFDSRFDFSTSVQLIYPGLKERYLHCIEHAP